MSKKKVETQGKCSKDKWGDPSDSDDDSNSIFLQRSLSSSVTSHHTPIVMGRVEYTIGANDRVTMKSGGPDHISSSSRG